MQSRWQQPLIGSRRRAAVTDGRWRTTGFRCDMVLLRLPARRSRSPEGGRTLCRAVRATSPAQRSALLSDNSTSFTSTASASSGAHGCIRQAAPYDTMRCHPNLPCTLDNEQKAICLRLYVVRRHTKHIKRSLSCTDGIYPRKEVLGEDDCNRPPALRLRAGTEIAHSCEAPV